MSDSQRSVGSLFCELLYERRPRTMSEAVGLLGPNGAGKSTLVSIMAGLLRLDDVKVGWA